MITYAQAIVLGALQGLTELFPISSLGHSVIVPQLLGWQIDQQDPSFVIFLVGTHTATALVLLGFFWRDWYEIVKGLLRSLFARGIRAGDTYARLGWLLVLATIPAGLLGLLFQKTFERLFASPAIAALFLAGNGLLLWGAELLRRRSAAYSGGDAKIARLSWFQGFGIGCMQCLALLPGFSRTGSTLSGGLLAGLSHEDAARFSFLLATPIIFAASVLKLPALLKGAHGEAGIVLAGALASAIAAYLSVRFLIRYFRTNTLTPFAVYCFVAGIGAFFLLH